MKKWFSFALAALLVLFLAACGGGNNDSAEKEGARGQQKN